MRTFFKKPGCQLKARWHDTNGASLIEVLVSLFLLSIILLSFDASQLLALQKTKQIYLVNLAMNQLNAMEDHLRLLGRDDYAMQVATWNKENERVLPHGQGVVMGQYPAFDINIFWGKQRAMLCTEDNIGESGCLRRHIIIAKNQAE